MRFSKDFTSKFLTLILVESIFIRLQKVDSIAFEPMSISNPSFWKWEWIKIGFVHLLLLDSSLIFKEPIKIWKKSYALELGAILMHLKWVKTMSLAINQKPILRICAGTTDTLPHCLFWQKFWFKVERNLESIREFD